MKIVEIFKSIQGEGHFIGMAATFIRTYGCNLKCDFCDTKQSWNGSDEFDNMDIEDIMATVKSLNCQLVVITGGEPGIHQSLLGDLVDQLKLAGCLVAIETNGTCEMPSGIDWVTCSPKEDANYVINTLCKPNELKYVVTDDFDITTAIPETVREIYAGNIWLQPDGYHMQDMWHKCYAYVKADNRLRVGVQLHKLMEVQ